MAVTRNRAADRSHNDRSTIVRHSSIHGYGVFARRRIPAGRRVLEYRGELISSAEADARYDESKVDPAHVLLFSVDDEMLIDAGRGGNEARYVNHSCEPNCESVLDDRRVFIQTLRPVASGEELTYDYNLSYEGRVTSEVRRLYRCRCGSDSCRGTMLAPRPERPTRRPRAARSAG